jgi:hypothetical protein
MSMASNAHNEGFEKALNGERWSSSWLEIARDMTVGDSEDIDDRAKGFAEGERERMKRDYWRR